ncbi:MAG: hypothetical protein LK562_09140 [Candidatus Accumulibacter phosphatis]|nr:hypothetical protein [Candidatus Accumulibacter phosphatis]
MQLTLVVPELLWPEPDDRESFDALRCDALNTLIARSQRTRRPPQSLEATLCDVFGLPGNAAGNAAYAAFRALGEVAGPAVASDCWLCADPVHLRLHQERLILADGSRLDINAAEATAIVDELNRQFPDLGTFHIGTPDRWYLQLAGNIELGRFDVLPLSAVAGRSVGRQLPENAELRWLRQLLNEVQMVLHQHPANTRREDAGQSTINSLWLWGAGVLPAGRAQDCTGVWSDHPLARGLGRAFGVPVQAVPDDAAALLAQTRPGSRPLLVLDSLQAPVQYEDGEAYRAQLLALEARWFAPLQRALALGRIRHLRLAATTAYAMLIWESSRSGQWRLWRRPQSLAATVQTLAKGHDQDEP